MQDKKTLITIIVLLAISLSGAIIGTVYNFKSATSPKIVVDDNPNKDLIYKNSVYFYSGGTLLGTYACSNCKRATSTIDDEEYGINYYKDGNKELPTVYGDAMGVINENDKIELIAIKAGIVSGTYDAIKTYNVEHTNSIMLVKKDNKYAIFSVNPIPRAVTEFEYDFLAVPNRVSDGKLDTSKIIAKVGDFWTVLEYNPTTQGWQPYNEVEDKIIDLNDRYFATYDEINYKLYDYYGTEVISSVTAGAKEIIFGGEYVGIVLNNTLLVYGDVNNSLIKSVTLPDTYEELKMEVNNNEIIVLADNQRV